MEFTLLRESKTLIVDLVLKFNNNDRLSFEDVLTRISLSLDPSGSETQLFPETFAVDFHSEWAEGHLTELKVYPDFRVPRKPIQTSWEADEKTIVDLTEQFDDNSLYIFGTTIAVVLEAESYWPEWPENDDDEKVMAEFEVEHSKVFNKQISDMFDSLRVSFTNINAHAYVMSLSDTE